MAYQARIADGELAARLESSGAVLIEGPKASGKTETARQQAASEVRLDVDGQQRAAAEITPELVLDRPAPLLIDEWQLVPSIWAHVRRAVDDRQARAVHPYRVSHTERRCIPTFRSRSDRSHAVAAHVPRRIRAQHGDGVLDETA